MWGLLRVERTLLEVLWRWTTRARLLQERTSQSGALASGLVLALGTLAVTPGRLTLVPATVADAARTGLLGLARRGAAA